MQWGCFYSFPGKCETFTKSGIQLSKTQASNTSSTLVFLKNLFAIITSHVNFLAVSVTIMIVYLVNKFIHY